LRLISYGDLEAQQLPGSSHWKIPLPSLLAFEAERERRRNLSDDWSRDLDALGAPAERAAASGVARLSTPTSSTRASSTS